MEGVIEIELGLKLFEVVQRDGWAGRLLEFGPMSVSSMADQVQALRVTSPGGIEDRRARSLLSYRYRSQCNRMQKRLEG
jgi:hypothetical protein